jgi:cytochrome c
MSKLTTFTATMLVAGLAQSAFAEGDAEAGKKVYINCKSCHAVGEGAKNKLGPILNGIVDAEIASVDGFRYSAAFLAKKEEGMIWTEEALNTYLKKPRDFIRGRMGFGGLENEEERLNVIAYLKTFD